MSHELRTPLNAVIGFSEIMESGMFGPLGADKYHEYCRDIRESGQYLLDVINDILDMSKIEAGRIRLELENLELERLLTDAMRVVAPRGESKKLTLKAEVAPGVNLSVDRRAFKQIMLNLLSNAVKFTPEGGRVTVRARPTGQAVTIAIQDSGIGIPAEALKKLGRPFEQVENQWRHAHALDAGPRHCRARAAAARARAGARRGGLRAASVRESNQSRHARTRAPHATLEPKLPPGVFMSKPTEGNMGRGLLLWLIGIPLPIILIVWLLGGLHG